MTCDEVRIAAQLLCGFQLDSVTAFMWAKDAIAYIARTHLLSAPKKTVEVEIKHTGQIYQVEEEFVRLESITVPGERRNVSMSIVQCDEDGEMQFWKTGKYRVKYRYVPAMPETVNDQIPLPERYAELIKFYLAARQRWRTFGQNDGEALSFDNMFNGYLDTIDATMERANKRYRRMPARY